MQAATETLHYPELAGPKLHFRLEYVIELILLGKRMSSVAVDRFGVVWKALWIMFVSSR